MYHQLPSNYLLSKVISFQKPELDVHNINDIANNSVKNNPQTHTL